KPAAMKGDRTPAPRPKKPAKPASPKPAAATAPPAPPAASRRSSKLPPLTLLHGEDSGGANSEQAQIQARIIEDTLASFGIPVEVVETHIGPTVTQFGIAPGTVERAGRLQRIRVNKIVALGDDLALALAASPVRIEAPVPGRPYVGIEVPNADATLVSLRRLLQDKAFRKVGSPLALPMGRDVSGAAIAVDLRRLPHLLIAGATGSGKSVALNAIICALLFNTLPDTLRLILVDPKRVELPGYNGIPHLLAPVVTDAQHAEGALTWLLIEMDERYRRFSEAGARDIDSYNAGARPGDRLPYIVMIIDELADLMVTAAETIEVKLVRLAQMARATGIHLIIATQRPSVDVVTGLIKANFPARLAFAVTSQIDSRVILDTPGADKLLGRGDGLLMTADSAKLRRVQGCFVSDSEIFALVQWWQEHHPGPAPDPTQPRYPWSQLLVEEATKEDMLLQAIEQLRGRQYISASGLQRLLNIGYPRAARLMEQLYEAGVVGEEEDRRTGRPVLLEDEAWEEG
ncbi:MAG: DNA translocase FtsK, partial [Caldilineales bacterium]|nr:DNA translocase FtsK [Caldilineales bacterium]